MAKPGVTIVHAFDYRGNPNEEFSNTYHFTGSHPSDDAGWTSLIDALVDLEYLCLRDNVSYVRAYGYDDTDNDATFVYDDLGGTGPHATGALTSSSIQFAPGDCAAWCRWKTSRLNSKGKPIYLRKYFHSIGVNGGTDGYDQVETGQKSAMKTFADAVQASSGDWPGLAGPQVDEDFLSDAVSTYVTTRTLKRRGKRPS